MIRLGNLALNGIPRVAVGFRDNVSTEMIQDIENLGLDVVELRIDQYSSFERQYVLSEVKKFKDFPSIATIRSEKEGGEWKLSDEKRWILFKAVLPYVNAVDIELYSRSILKEVVSAAHRLKKLVVISYHNFDKTPGIDKLNEVTKEAKASGADIVKIATFVLSNADIQILADYTIKNSSKNIITIGMGSIGTISRILFSSLGSLMTYASMGKSTAPGQLEYKLTVELLRTLYPKYNEEKINSLKLLELA